MEPQLLSESVIPSRFSPVGINASARAKYEWILSLVLYQSVVCKRVSKRQLSLIVL